MRVAVLGTGMIGNMVVRELAASPWIDEVVAIDAIPASLDRCINQANHRKVVGKVASLSDPDIMDEALQGVDIAVACIPHSLSLPAMEAAIRAGCHLVDLVGSKYVEKTLLDEKARQKGVLLIPGAGVAPGIVNFLAARGVELLDEADEAVMICGGIPRHPLPPLWYQVVFRLESVMGLYTRSALAAENGELVELAPLSGIQTLTFPGVSEEFEAVVTDAHSTAHTLKDRVKRLYEKTVRYKGHWNKMQVLAELGFLNEEPVEVEGTLVSPRKLAMVLLEPQMKGATQEDMTVVRVTVKGKLGGEDKEFQWEMIDLYDQDRCLTSMAKTTGFPAVVLTEWIAQGKFTERGVSPVEKLIIGDRFDPFVRELEKHGVRITFTEI